MFWDKKLLYKGSSQADYTEIINILILNNLKFTDKIKMKNRDVGPIINKIMVGTMMQREDFAFEYSIYINKENFEVARRLIRS